jgi:hypothetical protein
VILERRPRAGQILRHHRHLAGITERFCIALESVDISFLSDGILDDLCQLSRISAVRVCSIDQKQSSHPRHPDAVLALAAAPAGSASDNWLPKSVTCPDSPPTPSGKPDTTCANSAARTASANPGRNQRRRRYSPSGKGFH